ncbi:type II toxin-antitoxin system HicB family antitoxin [Limosilactobacillus vaginalis]|uniref:type II toxin-antitoxin system HicB family antitoxin n=1 Tax=Limosilactobacillus vaginalis TaxID=1633 RepID=UPI0022A976A2|nr:type II toxin-antitoxin system HicB family antitoxin [Limosilactobacillus vaginalis]MCZ2465755.1 type II toxin-antitoxin system HicB family antitoxin [Limosilactobacillus vaginalis]
MKEKILIYPVILTECNDEAGHYYGISSPNIKGMVTDGKTMQEAVLHAENAIATMISDMADYPEVQDPRKWKLGKDDSVMWVTVNMVVNTDLKLSEITGLKMYFFTGLNAALHVVPCNLSYDMICQKF